MEAKSAFSCLFAIQRSHADAKYITGAQGIVQVLSFIVILGLVFLVSATGGTFSPGDWYAELQKPALTPPGWVFTPVWLILYVMIAVAGWLVWKRVLSLKHPAVLLWGCQLVLNALWSFLFFGLQNPGLALVDLLMMLFLILAFIGRSYQVHKAAALLFLPYALWTGFAVWLNLGILILN